MTDQNDPDEHPDVQKLRAEPDPARRGALATAILDGQRAVRDEVTRIRLECVDQLYAQGLERPQIAETIGVSPGRISQMRRAGPRPERALLGTSHLTVALGGKQEADKSQPGPVVSQDDLVAYEYLATCASELGLTTSSDVVQPPGHINLNRPNLVVVCGPRLSPNVAEILDGDPHYGFAKAENWYLYERARGGRSFPSPIDGDPATSDDVAYLGRLPRPDRRGTFLYLAGVHAPGCAVAAHYLTGHLAELYETAPGRSPWSLLVQGSFDTDRRITSSEAVTDLRRWSE